MSTTALTLYRCDALDEATRWAQWSAEPKQQDVADLINEVKKFVTLFVL